MPGKKAIQNPKKHFVITPVNTDRRIEGKGSYGKRGEAMVAGFENLDNPREIGKVPIKTGRRSGPQMSIPLPRKVESRSSKGKYVIARKDDPKWALQTTRRNPFNTTDRRNEHGKRDSINAVLRRNPKKIVPRK
ncbi:MAG: hypothetical protein NUV67_04150 [archaeon]|nr:hypothetical protein [archaeon]